MANTLYDAARERFLKGQFDWMNDTIKVILVDIGNYTFSPGHQWLSDVGTTARINGAAGLGGMTLTAKGTAAGAANAGPVTFTTVTGPSIEAIIIYKDTGSGDSTCPLIAYIDTGTGLPITPNGGDIIVTWDQGPNKIFKV